eukprot:Ihof_evm2s149 gene=Ihof_evmTU2s149
MCALEEEFECKQLAARQELMRRHRQEVDKFKQYVEGEIVNACQTYATQGSDASPPPYRSYGRSAPGVCEYLAKQRYGGTPESSSIFDRHKTKFTPDQEFAKTLVAQKAALTQRHQYEVEALQAAQRLEWRRHLGEPPEDIPL